MSGQLLKSGTWKPHYSYRVQQCNEHKLPKDHTGCKQTSSLVTLFIPLLTVKQKLITPVMLSIVLKSAEKEFW